MNLIQLLKQPSQLLATDNSVICFNTTSTYPLLFFALFLERLKTDQQQITFLDLNQQTQAIAQLETSFLGTTRWYWLGNFDELSKAQQKEWLRYVQAYKGPNKLLYAQMIDQKKNIAGSSHAVMLPAHVDKKLFKALFAFFIHEPKAFDERRIDELFAKTDSLDLDQACLLLQYVRVMGARSKEFYDHWLHQLVVPQNSLFRLSQYFFARQRSSFLKYWRAIKDEYPEQFWISYWSDQLWRAAFYCRYMKERKLADAKKIGYRLPFSFLQKDYHNVTFNELLHAHQSLYELDYELKHGGSSIGLDLLLCHFFT